MTKELLSKSLELSVASELGDSCCQPTKSSSCQTTADVHWALNTQQSTLPHWVEAPKPGCLKLQRKLSPNLNCIVQSTPACLFLQH